MVVSRSTKFASVGVEVESLGGFEEVLGDFGARRGFFRVFGGMGILDRNMTRGGSFGRVPDLGKGNGGIFGRNLVRFSRSEVGFGNGA